MTARSGLGTRLGPARLQQHLFVPVARHFNTGFPLIRYPIINYSLVLPQGKYLRNRKQLYTHSMAAGGQEHALAIRRALGSTQAGAEHIAKVLLCGDAVLGLDPITVDQFPGLSLRIGATQRRIRIEVTKLTAELPNRMSAIVLLMKMCGDNYKFFCEAYCARYDGGLLNTLLNWMPFARDDGEIKEYIQSFVFDLQRIIEHLDGLRTKLDDVNVALQASLEEVDQLNDEYRRRAKNKAKEARNQEEERLKAALTDAQSRYYHSLFGFGASTIAAIAAVVSAILFYRNSKLPPEVLADTVCRLTKGDNAFMQMLSSGANVLVNEGIVGNWRRWEKARNEWYDVMQQLTALPGGGGTCLHTALQQLSQHVVDLQGHLVHVIADWKYVRDQVATTAQQIEAAAGKKQPAVICNDLRAAAVVIKTAIDSAEACIPRPDTQRQ